MQFSLFGAEAAHPQVDDLAGVLFGGGQWSRGDGAGREGAGAQSTAGVRLSVLVDAPWRQVALLDELAMRDIAGERFEDPMLHDAQGKARIGVRTGYDPALAPMAAGWLRGANIAPPPNVTLAAAGVRIWAICAGHAEDVGYLLRTREQDSPVHRVGGAQLARLGLAAVSVGERGGPGWRVTGSRRRHRLAELVGVPPKGADGDWPRL